ncbi:MAG: type II secretion system protein [Candidatus Omnitrophota bacterium]
MAYQKYKQHQKGFTLIETLIATFISIVAIAIIYSIYSSGNDLWENKRCQIDLSAKGHLAMEQMLSELKNATRTSTQNPSPNINIPSTPNNKNIQFYLPLDNDGDGYITDANGDIEWDTSNHIQYQYIPGQNLLRRNEGGGNQKDILRDVTSIQFIDNSIDSSLFLDEVKIVFTLTTTTPRQRTIAMTFSGTVKLRN